jgi:hypothetical protein
VTIIAAISPLKLRLYRLGCSGGVAAGSSLTAFIFTGVRSPVMIARLEARCATGRR